MTAHCPVKIDPAVGDKDFYERFIGLRLKLKTLGAEIISVHHANHRVDVDWLPQGSNRDDEPIRSTLFRFLPVNESGKTSEFIFASGGTGGAMSMAI
ncbi:hypothetical protein [Microvirga solisilvae]|uniref:hypothetical protein n=1 Tax=Microvirga solisilvae TaxID=2919498 RepID=UPI001FB025BB|nr:hypothetical protein [Microvirga solisilvae]